jgi:signal transduction histidine kinase
MNSPLHADDLSALVLATLGTEQAGISNMLESITKRMDAFGCGLWEVGEYSDLKADPPQGYLMTVAAWWGTGRLFAMDDVPLGDSPTGWVAVHQRSRICNDIQVEGGAKREHPFWKRHDVHGMCAVPVRFLDYRLGALNVYRQGGSVPFSEDDQERLERMAALVPGLFRAVRQKIGLNLVSDVEELLRKSEGAIVPSARTARKTPTEARVKQALKGVCQLVGRAFDSVEVSLFLEPTSEPGSAQYHCVATTQQKCIAHKKVYSSKIDRGSLTGWALSNWRPIVVHDLAKLDRDADLLVKRYPGLERTHGEADIKDARHLLRLRKDEDLPPLSFMAVPVFGGQALFRGTDLRGVLRCHMARSGPYFFTDREANLLSVVAGQIGRYWARWRAGCEMEQENKAWNLIGDKLGELNTFVRQRLTEKKLDEEIILKEALRLTSAVIPGAELNSVRLFDSTRKELFCAAFSEEGEKELARLRLNKAALPRFSVSPNSESWGVKVYLSGKAHEVGVGRGKHRPSQIFPTVSRRLIVPIGVDNQRFGVLDLRWVTKPIPPYAERAATLLGQQIGIYHQLATLVSEQQLAAERTEKQKLEEITAYEDFAHQLKSPINQAQLRAQACLGSSVDEDDRRRWAVMRGLVRRAGRVTMSLRLLTELSHGRPISLKPTPLEQDTLLRKLIELADDAQHTTTERRITFRVERDTIAPSLVKRLVLDVPMLEQMLDNLLDNAAKYSSRGSVVRIFSGESHTGRIFFAVANEGLPFGPGEAENSKKRGWRSPNAKLIVAEGQGIGLWLVDQLMKAHGGELQIIAPNKYGENEVRLAFKPATKTP